MGKEELLLKGEIAKKIVSIGWQFSKKKILLDGAGQIRISAGWQWSKERSHWPKRLYWLAESVTRIYEMPLVD